MLLQGGFGSRVGLQMIYLMEKREGEQWGVIIVENEARNPCSIIMDHGAWGLSHTLMQVVTLDSKYRCYLRLFATYRMQENNSPSRSRDIIAHLYS